MSRWLLLSGLCLWSLSAMAEGPEDKAFGVRQREVQVALESLPQNERPPKRFALLIGVAKYEDERIPALPYCEKDVLGMKKLLTDPLRGMFPAENVTVLLDDQVTRPNVVAALDELGQQVGPNDLALVFFTGHGATDSRKRSYWVMHNTKIDSLRASGLEEVEVTDLLGDIKTSRLVVLIDACFSASTAKLPENDKSLLDVDKLYPQFQGKGRVAITSSSGEELSVVIHDEKHPGFGYSAFSWHVQEALQGAGDKDRDGVITVTELWEHVEKTVPVTARKMGGDHAPRIKGDMGGRFLLAVDASRLTENLKLADEQRRLLAERLQQLRKLALDEKLTVNQFAEGRRLLELPADKLTEADQLARSEYLSMLEGRLAPEKLQRALDLHRKRQNDDENWEQNGRPELLTAPFNSNDGRNAQRAWAKYLGRDVQEEIDLGGGVKLRMVLIPPGTYRMGSGPDEQPGTVEGLEKEVPQHQVTITRPFYLSVHEVTVAQYKLFAAGDIYGSPNQPVTNISCQEIEQSFLGDLNEHVKGQGKFRLPTEAEWEYACRSGSVGNFYYGDALTTEQANIYYTDRATNPKSDLKEVGRYQPNSFGLYDMHGNAWEWCGDGPRGYTAEAQNDPQGNTALGAVARGGSYHAGPRGARSAVRAAYSSRSTKFGNFGFRLAREIPLN